VGAVPEFISGIGDELGTIVDNGEEDACSSVEGLNFRRFDNRTGVEGDVLVEDSGSFEEGDEFDPILKATESILIRSIPAGLVSRHTP
jgi:hypothetical protein